MEITEFQPNKSMSMIIKDGPVEMKGTSEQLLMRCPAVGVSSGDSGAAE